MWKAEVWVQGEPQWSSEFRDVRGFKHTLPKPFDLLPSAWQNTVCPLIFSMAALVERDRIRLLHNEMQQLQLIDVMTIGSSGCAYQYLTRP